MSDGRWVLLLALSAIGSSVQATETACPSMFQGRSLQIGSVLDGPAENKAILIADASRRKNGAESARWDVDYLYAKASYVTLDCRYGNRSDPVHVVIEAKMKTCVYSKSGQRGVRLACRP